MQRDRAAIKAFTPVRRAFYEVRVILATEFPELAQKKMKLVPQVGVFVPATVVVLGNVVTY